MEPAPPKFVRPRGITGLALACLVLPGLVWFGRALVSNEMFLVRDAAHYYWPLYQYLAQEWGAGHVPLWNPFENGGQPLAADATCAAFYPGKLWFALPLPYDWLYKSYLVGHLALAAGAAWRLARHWQCGPAAAAVAALAYAGSGTVMYQYANVAYLVGAAWLPLALGAGDRMFAERSQRWALACGAILALMVLGGDPQAAYNAGLALVLLAVLRRGEAREPCGPQQRTWLCQPLGLLCQAALACLLLAAVQLLLSAEYGRRSDRAIAYAPRCLYEGLSVSGWLGGPEAGDHYAAMYAFSNGPWRLAEMLWPNFSGSSYPVSRRWIHALPGEGRDWTPSLYFGLVPCWLAVCAFRLRGAALPVRWMSWLALLGIVGSWGWYGVGFWLQFLGVFGNGAAANAAMPLSPGAGSLYWFLATFLPGYIYFRYPAKLMVFAALGLALLAAWGWQRWEEQGASPRQWRCLAGLAALSLALAPAVWFLDANWVATWLDVPADELFGPFDASGALADLAVAFLHTAVVGLATCVVLFSPGKQPGTARLALVLIMVSCDLAIAHANSIPTAPRSLWTYAPRPPDLPSGRFAPRLAHQVVYPPAWSTTASPERLQAVVAREFEACVPKYHLPQRVPVSHSQGLVMPAETALLQGYAYSVNDSYELGRVGHVFLDDQGFKPAAWNVAASPVEISFSVQAEVTAAGASWKKRRERNEALALAASQGLRATAPVPQVEWNGTNEATRAALALLPTEFWLPPDPTRDTCAVVAGNSPQRVELAGKLSRPALVTLHETYDPNWQAQVRAGEGTAWRPVELVRVNGFSRGVVLPAGEFHVRMEYRPAVFFWGAAVSGACSLALAAWGARGAGRAAQIW